MKWTCRTRVFLFTLFFLHTVLSFAQPLSKPKEPLFIIKLFGINDFHGQISPGQSLQDEPVGSAPVLAAYLKRAQTGVENRSLIVFTGDMIGASPPSSGLLHDEPTILFFNSLANSFCNPDDRMHPQCNVVATLGNHEFDKGKNHLMNLIYGSNAPPTDSWIPLPYFPGASFPFISANILDKQTQKPLFPPYVIKYIHDTPIAFIGAILKNAPDTMLPGNAEELDFIDEAKAINQYLPEIKAQGAKIIIALLHEGGDQLPYEGQTKKNTLVKGNIKKIVHELDNGVDVVLCGHTHQFLNAYLPNHDGNSVLVTQAYSYSAAFAEITLEIDKTNQKLVNKYAKIITAYANQWPGTEPDEPTRQLIKRAESTVEPIVNAYIGTAGCLLSKKQNEHGESNLGDFITDAFKTILRADIGMTNPHGLRHDIQPGAVYWGDLFSVLPFSNEMVKVTLTGEEIHELLEEQWMGEHPNLLQLSGLSYVYDANQAIGHKIIRIYHQNDPLIKEKHYTIATTHFLASGGGVFKTMKKSHVIEKGKSDLDTVIEYIQSLPHPFTATIEGRIIPIPTN